MSAAKRQQALLEARHHMSKLLALPDGADLLVDGQRVQKQPYPGEVFGHPDNKALLQVGYGPGRWNREVSVAALAAGYVRVEIPE